MRLSKKNLRKFFFTRNSRWLEVDAQEWRRIKAFKETPFFNVRSGSYSPYWKYNAKLIQATSNGGNSSGAVTVEVSGESGFYITPSSETRISKITSSLARSVREGRMGRQVTAWSTYPRPVMTSYENAYAFVMNSGGEHPRLPGAIPFPLTAKNVRQCFNGWSGREGTGHVLIAYYLLSLIVKQVPLTVRPLRILEIGPGSGNLASLFLHYFPGTRITLVDLPETLQLSFLYLRSLFPHLDFVLPNEVTAERLMTADVVFLTPDQIQLIPDGSVDISMNVHSFQEMLMPQIATYFTLLERVTCSDGYVLVVNRSEKMPNPEETSNNGIGRVRFAEYPWVETWTDLIYVTSPFHLLVQTNDVMIRLVRV